MISNSWEKMTLVNILSFNDAKVCLSFSSQFSLRLPWWNFVGETMLTWFLSLSCSLVCRSMRIACAPVLVIILWSGTSMMRGNDVYSPIMYRARKVFLDSVSISFICLLFCSPTELKCLREVSTLISAVL